MFVVVFVTYALSSIPDSVSGGRRILSKLHGISGSPRILSNLRVCIIDVVSLRSLCVALLVLLFC